MNAFSTRRLVTLFTLSRLLFPALALLTSPTRADDLQSETRALPPYHAVDISGSMDVTWALGETDSAVVKASGDLLSRIRTEVKDGRLKIYVSGWFVNASKMSVMITSHRLDEIAMTGSGDFAATRINADKLKVDVSGSGDLTLSGEVGKLNISLSGSGDITADHLQAQRANISVAGSGDVAVRASDYLNASVAGSGDVTYSGNPQSVMREVFGSGDVKAAR